MQTIKIDATGEYQVVPAETDDELVLNGEKYLTFEGSRPHDRQVSSLLTGLIETALSDTRAALTAAGAELTKAKVSGTAVHAAMTEATPLLNRAIVLLTRQYEANLSRLGEWGLPTKYGARDQILVIKPAYESERADFLIAFTRQENSLPLGERLPEVPLARLTELAAIVQAGRTQRTDSVHTREQQVAQRSQSGKTLHDLLQVACALIVMVHYAGHVMPALQDWGFKVQRRKTPPAANDAADSPVTA